MLRKLGLCLLYFPVTFPSNFHIIAQSLHLAEEQPLPTPSHHPGAAGAAGKGLENEQKYPGRHH